MSTYLLGIYMEYTGPYNYGHNRINNAVSEFIQLGVGKYYFHQEKKVLVMRSDVLRRSAISQM